MAVKAIPDDYHAVTPFLTVQGAGKLIDFMKSAFGAEERMCMPMPDGTVAHAELTIGDSVVMVSDATPEFPAMPGSIHLYVEDCDATYKQALAAGAKSHMEPKDQFYGDRSANITDPAGNRWSIATHIEDVGEEDMMKRMAEMAPA